MPGELDNRRRRLFDALAGCSFWALLLPRACGVSRLRSPPRRCAGSWRRPPGFPPVPAGPLSAPAAPTLASSMMTPFADLAAAAAAGPQLTAYLAARNLHRTATLALIATALPEFEEPRRPAFLGGGRDRRHSLPGARGGAFGRPGDHAPHVATHIEVPAARGRAGPVGQRPLARWRRPFPATGHLRRSPSGGRWSSGTTRWTVAGGCWRACTSSTPNRRSTRRSDWGRSCSGAPSRRPWR